MDIDKLKILISRYENTKKSKRDAHEDKSNSLTSNKTNNEPIEVLKEYISQHKEKTFCFGNFYTYAEEKYKKEWVLRELSETILSQKESFIGAVFRECRQRSLQKLPAVLLTDVLNTYLDAAELSTMTVISRLISQKTTHSKRYQFWKNTRKWKAELIKLGCRKEPLTIALNTMHVQNPEYLYYVLKNQEEFVKGYGEPWAFYLLSGELKPIDYAITYYQLTDETRTRYHDESPFMLAVFSGNYQASDLVIKKMTVNFNQLTGGKLTLLHMAAWSKSNSQVEYIKCLIQQRNLAFTVNDRDSQNRDVYYYAHKNQEIIQALSKPVEEIDVEKFVDEEGKPLFTSLIKNKA